MADWEKKIDIRKVFVLQPTRPTTYFGVGAVAKVGDILAGLAVPPERPLDAGKPADTALLRRVAAFAAMSAEFQTC